MSDKRKQSFLYKTQHSVTVVREERAHDLILIPSFNAFRWIIDCTRSMCFIPSFACVSVVIYNTECGEEMNV